MSESKVEIFDIQRMTLGDLPFGFLSEIIVRSLIMYVFLLIMMRFVGSRSMSQMSNFEFVLLIALGSSVGDPMFYEDVPILHGMITIAVIILMEKFLARITEKNKELESIIEGNVRCLVKDSVALVDELAKEGLSVGELFSNLRSDGVENLGEIKRAYIEPSGKISIFRYCEDEIKYGLYLTPENIEEGYLKGQSVNGLYSCNTCGNTINFENTALTECDLCKNKKWSISQKKKK